VDVPSNILAGGTTEDCDEGGCELSEDEARPALSTACCAMDFSDVIDILGESSELACFSREGAPALDGPFINTLGGSEPGITF